jgi:hypothetical protein
MNRKNLFFLFLIFKNIKKATTNCQNFSKSNKVVFKNCVRVARFAFSQKNKIQNKQVSGIRFQKFENENHK